MIRRVINTAIITLTCVFKNTLFRQTSPCVERIFFFLFSHKISNYSHVRSYHIHHFDYYNCSQRFHRIAINYCSDAVIINLINPLVLVLQILLWTLE
jgi:hypothetical protein